MRPPYTEWTCDHCAQSIKDPGMALIAWRREQTTSGPAWADFRIIHKGKCDFDQDMATAEISTILDIDGMNWMLGYFGRGPVSGVESYLEVIRRLYVPNYEAARRLFDHPNVRAELGALVEASAYSQAGLKRIIELGRPSGD